METNNLLKAIHKPKADEVLKFYCSETCFWYPKYSRLCSLFDKTLKSDGVYLIRCSKCVIYEE